MNTFENGMTKLLVSQIAEIYFCENQLLHALDRMAEAATHPELKALFLEHRVETEGQITRLESIFTTWNETPRAYPCRGMEGLLENGLWTMRNLKHDPALDTALIAAAQKVEMLEIAAYRSAIALARQLGQEQIAGICEVSLDEETGADAKLGKLARAKELSTRPEHLGHAPLAAI